MQRLLLAAALAAGLTATASTAQTFQDTLRGATVGTLGANNPSTTPAVGPFGSPSVQQPGVRYAPHARGAGPTAPAEPSVLSLAPGCPRSTGAGSAGETADCSIGR